MSQVAPAVKAHSISLLFLLFGTRGDDALLELDRARILDHRVARIKQILVKSAMLADAAHHVGGEPGWKLLAKRVAVQCFLLNVGLPCAARLVFRKGYLVAELDHAVAVQPAVRSLEPRHFAGGDGVASRVCVFVEVVRGSTKEGGGRVAVREMAASLLR